MKNKYWKFAFFGLLFLALGSHVPTALQIKVDAVWVQAIFEGINCLIGAVTIGLVILGVRYQHHEIELQKQELKDNKADRVEADKRERLKAWPLLELRVNHHRHELIQGEVHLLHHMVVTNLGGLITNVDVMPISARPIQSAPYDSLPKDFPSEATFKLDMAVQLKVDETWTLTLSFHTLAGDRGQVRFEVCRDKVLKRWDDYPWQQAAR